MIIAQKPNPPLLIAVGAALIEYATTGIVHTVAAAVYFVAIGTWSYLEIAQGANWFRRVLGALVMTWTLYSLVLRLQ